MPALIIVIHHGHLVIYKVSMHTYTNFHNFSSRRGRQIPLNNYMSPLIVSTLQILTYNSVQTGHSTYVKIGTFKVLE